MALTKFTENVSNHQSLPDKPALTATQLKQLFDKAPEDIKDFLNTSLIPELDTLLNNILHTTDIINNLTTGGSNKVASADTVKNLNTALGTLNTQVSSLVTQISSLSTAVSNLQTAVNSKENNIPYGTEIPLSLSNGQKYIQYF